MEQSLFNYLDFKCKYKVEPSILFESVKIYTIYVYLNNKRIDLFYTCSYDDDQMFSYLYDYLDNNYYALYESYLSSDL